MGNAVASTEFLADVHEITPGSGTSRSVTASGPSSVANALAFVVISTDGAITGVVDEDVLWIYQTGSTTETTTGVRTRIYTQEMTSTGTVSFSWTQANDGYSMVAIDYVYLVDGSMPQWLASDVHTSTQAGGWYPGAVSSGSYTEAASVLSYVVQLWDSGFSTTPGGNYVGPNPPDLDGFWGTDWGPGSSGNKHYNIQFYASVVPSSFPVEMNQYSPPGPGTSWTWDAWDVTLKAQIFTVVIGGGSGPTISVGRGVTRRTFWRARPGW